MSKYVLLKNDGQVEMKELESALDLNTMYNWIGNDCRFIDIAESVINDKIGCKVILIFDDEFLLNHTKPIANKIASLFFGYTLTTDECLCGNVIVAKDVDGETAGFTDDEISKLEKLIASIQAVSKFLKFEVQEPCITFIPEL